jgi:hypothetical protein
MFSLANVFTQISQKSTKREFGDVMGPHFQHSPLAPRFCLDIGQSRGIDQALDHLRPDVDPIDAFAVGISLPVGLLPFGIAATQPPQNEADDSFPRCR